MRHWILDRWGAALAIAVAASTTAMQSAEAADSLSIRNASLTAALDPNFPRVFSYTLPDGRSVEGAIPGQRPTIKVNGQTYSAADLQISVGSQAAMATYSMVVKPLNLQLDWTIGVQGQQLHLELVRVREGAEAKLHTLEFPEQHLARMAANQGKAHAYRGEYLGRIAWKESFPGRHEPFATQELMAANTFSGLIGQSTGRFVQIDQTSGEPVDQLTNWASTDDSTVGATIATNIPYWKLSTQFLGGEGPATHFAIGLGPYQYRIAGDIQPLLQADVAILTTDRNTDGVINWMEAALWHRDRYPAPSATYEPNAFMYSIINDWVKPVNEPAGGFDPPVTSFAESLEIVRTVSQVIGNSKQHVKLVGWQFTGHDTGYPAMNQVNERLGGAAALRELERSAHQYNANILYHVNINDSYPTHPMFDRSVLQFNRAGEPFVWSYQFLGGPPDYRIPHTKQFRTGYFQKRIEQMMSAVPVEKVIGLDTFRNADISFGPGEDIGAAAEAAYGGKILDWLAERDLKATIEGPEDAFFGKVEHILWRVALKDPFQLLMMHGKVHGGGRYKEGVGQVLGWSGGGQYSVRDALMIGGHEAKKYNPASIADEYFLGNLTQFYLTKKNLVWLGATSDKEYLGRFSDGTVSKVAANGRWTVTDQGVLTVDDQRRMLPMSADEIILYGVEGGTHEWQLPAGWKNARITLSPVGDGRAKTMRYTVGSEQKVTLTTDAKKGYRVRRAN